MSFIDDNTIESRIVEERVLDMTHEPGLRDGTFLKELQDGGWNCRPWSGGKFLIYRLKSKTTRVEGDTHAI